MQNAKDSFYMALRTRLTVINPERTILLRGAVRPGILVEEAEAPLSPLPSDVFVLRWTGFAADMDLASTMALEQCEIVDAQAQLFGDASGRDADAGVLGRAGIWSDDDQPRLAEPQRKCVGLQLPGAGGVKAENSG